MLEKVSRIHETYLLDPQLFCWRHFSKTEVVQNTDLNILALYIVQDFRFYLHKWLNWADLFKRYIVFGMDNFGPGCHNNEPIFSFPIYPIGITIWRSAARLAQVPRTAAAGA